MKTNHVSELIDEYIDGTLDNVQRVTVELHLAECAECRREFEEVRSLVGALADMPREIETPDDLKRSIEATLEHNRLVDTIHRDNGMDRGAVRNETRKPVLMYRIAATILIGLVSASTLWFVLKDGDELPVLESKKEINEPAPSVAEKKGEVDSEVRERDTQKESAQSSSPKAVAKGNQRNRAVQAEPQSGSPANAVQEQKIEIAEDITLEGVTVEGTRPRVEAAKTNAVRVQADAMISTQSEMQGVAVAQGEGSLRRGRDQEFFDPGIGHNTEQYDHVGENEFKETLGNPLSTFSIDVDNASYSNIRRFITSGQLPPPGAVRIEEMINYFSYDYPQPKREHPFSVNMELAECPWNADNKLMLIGLQGKQIATADLPPSNLVFLIDVSGSMQHENKLPLVRRSFKLLVDQLRSVDRVAIVVYAGSAGLVLPSTPGTDKQTILDAIDRLEAGGSTAGGAGINLAYSVAKEHFLEEGNNRVILATDGDFNVGVTNDDELVRLIEEKRKDGIFLSILGFGFGNLKDSRMEKIADKGNGNYAYIDNIHEARKVLVSQMAGTLYTIAKDVKLQIEFNPANVKAYRLVGYENRMLNKEDFNDDRKDAGDMGAGHSVTALYEIVPADGDIELPDVDSLKYSQFSARTNSSTSNELATVKLRYKHPADLTSKLMVQSFQNRTVSLSAASMNLRFAAAVAQFGMLLRESKFKGDSSFESVLKLAKRAKGDDENGYRSEFIQLVETAKDLKRR